MKKFFYRVQKGDTVLSVARNFSVSVCEIIKCNNLTCEIQEGDLLYIEKDAEPYLVTPFDSLSSISEKFNIPKEKILLQNGIEYIFYGLTIKI